MLPVLLRNKFVIVGNEKQRTTRQAGNIVLKLHCAETPENQECTESMFYEGVKMYNFLSTSIKQSDRLKTFKRELKEYI